MKVLDPQTTKRLDKDLGYAQREVLAVMDRMEQDPSPFWGPNG
ncbi:MAG: hypothetical protein QM774_07565 [Gordonia sp. (in: high G+C Gram-positive bacteria)]